MVDGGFFGGVGSRGEGSEGSVQSARFERGPRARARARKNSAGAREEARTRSRTSRAAGSFFAAALRLPFRWLSTAPNARRAGAWLDDAAGASASSAAAFRCARVRGMARWSARCGGSRASQDDAPRTPTIAGTRLRFDFQPFKLGVNEPRFVRISIEDCRDAAFRRTSRKCTPARSVPSS